MDIMTIGERLKVFRKSKKISGEALGVLFDLSKQGISHLESDRTKLTAPQLETLIKEYPDLNIYWLINGKGEMIRKMGVDKETANKEAETCWKLLELERAKAETYLSILKQNDIKIE